MKIATYMTVLGLWIAIMGTLGLIGAVMCNHQALVNTLFPVVVIACGMSLIGLLLMLTITIFDT